MMQNNEKKINNDESCECGKINYDCSKNNKIVELWINDPSVFFDKKKLLEVWPNENMDREEKINTISRLVIYMTFFGMLIFNNIKLLITGIITLGILIVVYYVLKKKNNEFLEKSLKETFSNEALYEKYKHNFTNPMTKNPLMNVSLPEINDNPHRLTAAPAYNKAVEEKINNSVQDIVKNNFKDPKIADKLFKDTGDKFEFEQSMRQFYTTPNTLVPNNQKDFANFCYGNMASCKDGDTEMCLKATYRHANM
tara:strand:- start:675 stop:1433 length:759 start_codon:yes stop_codon:yes gene_type:complete